MTSLSPILAFYRGGRHPIENYTIDEALAWPDERWEECHSAVQYLFPLPEPSKMQPGSPVATAEDFGAFCTDPELRLRLIGAVVRFKGFLIRFPAWGHLGNHNLLRITRAIRCLTLAGMPDEAQELHAFAKERLFQQTPSAINDPRWDQTFYFWREALKEEPEWLQRG